MKPGILQKESLWALANNLSTCKSCVPFLESGRIHQFKRSWWSCGFCKHLDRSSRCERDLCVDWKVGLKRVLVWDLMYWSGHHEWTILNSYCIGRSREFCWRKDIRTAITLLRIVIHCQNSRNQHYLIQLSRVFSHCLKFQRHSWNWRWRGTKISWILASDLNDTPLFTSVKRAARQLQIWIPLVRFAAALERGKSRWDACWIRAATTIYRNFGQVRLWPVFYLTLDCFM